MDENDMSRRSFAKTIGPALVASALFEAWSCAGTALYRYVGQK